jgi:hypothetical protein
VISGTTGHKFIKIILLRLKLIFLVCGKNPFWVITMVDVHKIKWGYYLGIPPSALNFENFDSR